MKKYIIITLTIFLFFNCEDFLEEEVFTENDPSVFLTNKEGVDALLTGAYSKFVLTNFPGNDYFWLQEVNTDITWETGGGINRVLFPLIEFTWDPNQPYFEWQYVKFYEAIAASNNVLSVIKGLDNLDDATTRQIEAEARFIRGTSYYILHDFFGPTPIIEVPEGASLDEIEAIGKETPKATEEQYRTYVQGDLMFAAENLEFGGVSSRANRGSALAVLTKFYLNNKQWTEAATNAQLVIQGGGYELYDDFVNLFSVAGEGNNEYIYRFENLVGSNQQHPYMPLAFPPNYPIQSNWANFGAQARTYTAFYETFDLNDVRRNSFIREYTPTTTGVLTPLDRDTNGNALDDVRSFKYVPDPNAAGLWNGNDVPFVRLADIILSRAEALNELDGPTQESIDLINEIRNRAQANEVLLTDFADKEALRDFILAERGREFFTESLRRQDLIRHGKFIERAIARGKPAQAFHVLYPFSQAQVDNNPNLEQNPGY
ncbi:RagB/SusD family nutrient uptake outer membrane protein [Flavivirga algicola]|uniref:RagB/SusD family nutrient uptake outer membrane protein n=1 Tax=Flavivirga algicola TaxID=2729136 RepID=A0ABX1RTL5_9FLAO|nr:RagB/SusD family nutrient uptake outer membrane protein [Flavivirga algicola]NMH86897.1 RagB/SusD family nutrient uptake outer membrane protein [Flavivirga algicola]